MSETCTCQKAFPVNLLEDEVFLQKHHSETTTVYKWQNTLKDTVKHLIAMFLAKKLIVAVTYSI